MKEPNVQRTISFSPDTWRMLEEIKAHYGQKTLTGTQAQMISEMHRKLFPAYTTSKRPEGFTTKEEKERSAKESARQIQLDIAKQLDGVITVEDGVEICTYFTYARRDRYEQKFSVDLLTPEMVQNQYAPSREVVQRLIDNKETRWQ